MGPVIRFQTDQFDISKEDENPINPVFGQSILKWLKDNATELSRVTNLEPEDGGWCMYASFGDHKYYFEGSVIHDVPKEDQEWYLMLERQTGLKGKLLGQGKTKLDDPCFVYIKALIEASLECRNLEIDP